MKFWSNSEIPSAGAFVPEKRLLAAVLQRAVTDFVTGDGELREGARLWLFDDQPTDAPLTFQFICEALDLEVFSLRKAIKLQADMQDAFSDPQQLLVLAKLLKSKFDISDIKAQAETEVTKKTRSNLQRAKKTSKLSSGRSSKGKGLSDYF